MPAMMFTAISAAAKSICFLSISSTSSQRFSIYSWTSGFMSSSLYPQAQSFTSTMSLSSSRLQSALSRLRLLLLRFYDWTSGRFWDWDERGCLFEGSKLSNSTFSRLACWTELSSWERLYRCIGLYIMRVIKLWMELQAGYESLSTWKLQARQSYIGLQYILKYSKYWQHNQSSSILQTLQDAHHPFPSSSNPQHSPLPSFPISPRISNNKKRVSPYFLIQINILMLSLDRGLSSQQALQRNYEAFKQRKWQEYAKHHPQMGAKQATAKIVKDWNMLTIHQQLSYLANELPTVPLNLNFQQKNGMTPEKGHQANELGSTDSRKSAKNMEEQVGSEVQDSLRVNLSMMSEMQPEGSRLKADKKGGNMSYIEFYKGQYSKYAREHPKWTSQQISVIIKLLWKNRLRMREKRLALKTGRVEKSKKIVSGRKAFLSAKGKNGMLKWKKLPMESRMMWNKKGNPDLIKNQESTNKPVRLSCNPSNLSFINQK